MASLTSDFTIIGGGVIGITLAIEIKKRRPNASVLVLEKEAACGLHASGRNSGVLHAGFYYTADSLKAKFTRNGNRLLTEYCERKGLRINRCGKLVVAKDENDLPGIEELLRRGERNGVDLDELDESAAKRIEPRVKTYRKALFSPRTSTVDPTEVMAALVADAESVGVKILSGTRYLGIDRSTIRTNRGEVSSGYVINAAGLYADRVAKDFGFAQDYSILPFKGLYLYSNEPPGALRTNIYPVPDLRNPFLGVHFTVTVDGKAKIGPTAIPSFWREHYRGFENFNARELAAVVSTEMRLMIRAGFDFRGLAFEEAKKYYRPYIVAQAGALAEDVRIEDYTQWGKPGIRAQLVHLKDRKLVMDFCLEGDDRSFHVLNAVSPAFTCSIPFSEYVCDTIDGLLNRGSVQALTP